jgi:hypothetical protein
MDLRSGDCPIQEGKKQIVQRLHGGEMTYSLVACFVGAVFAAATLTAVQTNPDNPTNA